MADFEKKHVSLQTARHTRRNKAGVFKYMGFVN